MRDFLLPSERASWISSFKPSLFIDVPEVPGPHCGNPVHSKEKLGPQWCNIFFVPFRYIGINALLPLLEVPRFHSISMSSCNLFLVNTNKGRHTLYQFLGDHASSFPRPTSLFPLPHPPKTKMSLRLTSALLTRAPLTLRPVAAFHAKRAFASIVEPRVGRHASQTSFFPDEPATPHLKTSLPGPKTSDILSRLNQYQDTRSIIFAAGRFSVVVVVCVVGKGSREYFKSGTRNIYQYI